MSKYIELTDTELALLKAVVNKTRRTELHDGTVEEEKELHDLLQTIEKAEEGVFIPTERCLYYYNFYEAEHIADLLDISIEEAQAFIDAEDKDLDPNCTEDDAFRGVIMEKYKKYKEDKNSNNNV